MAHDVFISYSSVDKAIADAMCHHLEQDGIRCWIAPRDVRPGQEYAAEIIDALAASRACVLVFSANANASRHVKSEVERAVSHGIPIIPFRTQDVQPSKSMELFLGGRHWLDAISPPIEMHFQKLAHHLKFLVADGAAAATAAAPAPGAGQPAGAAGAGPGGPSLGRSSRKLLPLAAALLLVAGLGAATALFFMSRGEGPPRLPAAKSVGEAPPAGQDARTQGAATERVTAASAESPPVTQVAPRPAAGTERAATAAVPAGTGRALKAVAVKGEIEVDLGGGVKMNLVPIPAGEFMMGSPGDSGNFGERPQHLVRITKPFYLGKYKVTQEQWQAVMGNNPSSFKGPQYPVEQVSWDDCQTFIAWLNAKFAPPGKKFALPTEAQWEYACRAGSMAKYCFGDDISQLDDYAWYTKNSDGHSHPVGEKKPNAWGLYDVHGNVWEWCADCYQMAYYAQSPTDDPTGPKGTFLRVYRGSGWASFPGDCRSAARRQTIPGHGYHYLGLRVALVAAASVSAQERPSLNQAPSAKEHGPSGAAAVRNAPSVKGTTWRFPAAAGKTAASTVEFLDGGRFRWGGKPGEGFWKQDGNQITINVNGVTLFQLTLDGDTMRGTWERLAGNDAGQKHTSVLHRATD